VCEPLQGAAKGFGMIVMLNSAASNMSQLVAGGAPDKR
jgi:hypothetical protein